MRARWCVLIPSLVLALGAGRGNQSPAAVSVSPSSGEGLMETFAVRVLDPDGPEDVARVLLLANGRLEADGACLVEYHRGRNELRLMNDVNSVWLGPVTLGTAGRLANSQCVVDALQSLVVATDSSVTLHAALAFTPAFRGPKNVYALAFDAGGQDTRWQAAGTWTPARAVRWAPVADPASPLFIDGAARTFQVHVSDADGQADVTKLMVLINGRLDPAGACFIEYHRGRNELRLMNDANSLWLGPVALGSAGTLANSQCALDASRSWATGAGDVVTLNVALAFQAEFTGNKKVYVLGFDAGGLETGWQARGTWAVQ